MYQIRVNSIILEISPASVFVLNSLILDFNNITARGITSSNTLKLPLSQTNKEALEFPTPINSTSKAWTKLFAADILLGKNVIATGSVRLKGFQDNEITLQFQDDSRDFYDNLNRRANDIDFSDFDLIFNSTTFTSIANITVDQIWAYKNLQCAINGDNTDIDVFTRPCYSVRELLRKFIQVAGFEPDFTSISNSTEIDSLLLTSHADSFIVSDFRQSYVEKSFSGTVGTPDTLPIDLNDFAVKTSVLLLDTIKNDTVAYSLNLKGTITALGSASIIITNTVAPTETIALAPGDNFVNFTTALYDVNSISSIEIIGDVIFRDVFLYLILNEKDLADVLTQWESLTVPGESILDGYHFLGAHNLPNMTQLELFRNVWSLYFIKVDINDFNKTVQFSTFSQALKISAIDITDQIESSGSISPAQIFARQNLFSYSNDSDTFINYAQFLFQVPGEINKPIKNYIQIPFAASINKDFNGDIFARVEVYNKSAFDESESRTTLTNRLLLEKGDNAIFESLSWSFLFEKYYNPLFSQITQKRLQVSIYMTFDLFKQLNSIGFVFIRNQGLFFLEKIEAFQIGSPIKINLIYLI